MFKKIFLLSFSAICVLSAISQQTSVKYLRDYIKVWGFLKYYHPSFGSGKTDADSFFLKHLENVRTAKNDAGYAEVLKELQRQLTIRPAIISRDTTSLFRRNDHTGWVTTDRLLPAEFKKQLLYLRSQGYTDSVHRYMPANFFATDLPAEHPYDSIRFPNTNYQLLALARYWNAIEYLFAYKYMITRNWDKVLDEQITAFAKPMTQVEFEKHLLQLNTAIEDTHGGMVTLKQSAQVYGSYFPPYTFRFAGDSIVITDYLDSLSCVKQDLRIGDVILGVRNKTIAQAVAACEGFVSASNLHRKKSYLSSIPLLLPFRGMDSIINIKLLRNGALVSKQLTLQKPTGKQFLDNLQRLYMEQPGQGTTTLNPFVVRSLGNGVAQVDAANLSRLYNMSADDREIDSVMKEMLRHKKAILLDLRCYATQAVFYNKLLSALGWKLKPFAVLQAHHNRYPGTYEVKDIFSPVTQPPLDPVYPGKVILLVNERTQSQSELITMILQASGPAITVGTQTAGCDGDMIYLPVPGGYTLTFSGRHVEYPDGTASQKTGVKRNVKVSYTTNALARKHDEILERALKLTE